MSKVIDERVVSMQFDNKQFEHNVATSMSTIEKLKKSLNFTGASKGLENITTSARKCNLAPISSAVDTVGLKFNALYTIADQSLRNITNRVEQTAERIAKAFTIDPVKTGFQEYETQINAVQTILANTESKGETLETVNAALDTLNAYADKTIYNFTEMTRNIGTFTAAGVELDVATNAIQGIANLAAVSGSNAQQASTAMYQLSQALASGTVKLMDWNSVVNAGMGGQVFQDALKETARVHGVAIDDMIAKNGSFRETLKDGWLTSEILTETLQKFTLTTEGLTDAQIEANRQMLKSKGYTDDQIEEIFKLGETATNAATKVKTFTQLMDTLKEAAQSGWTQSWELIVGDFEEAKSLWTGVSDTFGEIINKMSESRNSVLDGALTSKWERFVQRMNEVGLSTEEFEMSLSEVLDDHGYDVDKIIEKYGSFGEAVKAGAFPVANLKEAIDRLSGSMTDLSGVETGLMRGSRGDQVKKVQEALDNLGFDLGKFGVDGIIGQYTEAAIKEFQELEGLEVTGIIDDVTLKALKEAGSAMGDAKKELFGLIDGVDELGGRDRLIRAFKNLWEALTKPMKAVGTAWNNIFGMSTEEKSAKLYKLIEGFESFTEKLIISGDSADNITRIFEGLFSALKLGATFLGGGFKMAFHVLSGILENFDLNILDVAAHIGDVLTKVHNWMIENNYLADALTFVFGMLVAGVLKIKEWIDAFIALPQVQERITAIGEAFASFRDYISGGIGKVRDFFKLLKGFDIKTLFGDSDFSKNLRTNLFKNFQTNVLGYFSNIREKLGEFVSKIAGSLLLLKNSAGEYLGVAGEKFSTFKDKLVGFFSTIKTWISDNKGAIVALGSLLTLIFLLGKIKKAITGIADVFEGFAGVGESISSFIDSFTALNKAKAFKIKTDAISNMVKSLALLAGAIFLLAQIPSDKMWQAVAAVGVMGGLIVGMLFLSKLINKMKVGSKTDVAQFGAMMVGVGMSLLLIATAIKIIGGMKPEEVTQGAWAITTFLIAIGALMAFSKSIGGKENDMNAFGKMIRKLSTSLLILSGVIYIFGKMKAETLIKGGLAVGVFLGMMLVIMELSGDINKDSNEFGKMIRNLSVSLLILSGVVYIFGHMKTETLIKGGIAVAAFIGIMLGAMALAKPMDKESASFGKMMLGLSTSLLLMALSVKILGRMDTATLVKGGLVVLGFVGIVTLLMDATKLMGKYSFNAGKMGLMLIGFAGAVLIITASIAALSMIDGTDLAKALGVIGGIGLIFAGLLYVTQFAKNIKTGTIIGLSVAIGVMAASVAVLSFIDPKKLITASLALSAVMGTFALIAYAARDIKIKDLVGLAGVALIVGGIAVVLTKLSENAKNADSALKVATAISELVIALSAATFILSKVGKVDSKALVAFGVISLIAGVLTGIAIWQLPNIAKQLSKFMKNLVPFIMGMKLIDSSMVKNIKTLGEAMIAFAGAGTIFAIGNVFTLGGVSRSFTKFGDFIKEIVPIVKDIAVDVSGENLHINHENLNSIINATKGLAEAANNAPSATMAAAITKFGGAGYIDIPLLSTFVTFIKEAVPIIKDMALELSGSDIDINTTNLNAVVGAISDLAEAASKAPSTTIAAGFAKFSGGWGVGGAVSIPGLSEFVSFVETITPIMSGFAVDISATSITSEDTATLTSLCEAVGILATAADSAPGIEALGGFSKFAGGWAVGAAVEIPGYEEFVGFVASAIPTISGLTLDLKETSIKAEDTETLKGLCEAVGILATAAGEAPGLTVLGGFAKFAGGVGLGGGVVVPGLDEFTAFVTEIVPIVGGLTLDIKETNIKTGDTETLKGICEAVEVLATAAGAAPSTTVAAGLAAAGPVIGGAMYITDTDLTKFTDWISLVMPVVTGAALDIKEASITTEDAAPLKAICDAVTVLAQASGYAPKEEVYAGAFGVYVSTTNLTDFKDWIVDILPVMSDFAEELSNATTESGGELITTDGLRKVQSICNAVKTLAGAAALAPKKETYSSIFGTWVEVEDIEGFTEWITLVMDAMKDLAEQISTEDFVLDVEKLDSIAKAAARLGESFYWFTAGGTMSSDFPGLVSNYVSSIATALQDFSKSMDEVNVDSVSKAATASYELGETVEILSGFTPESVDSEGFKTTLSGIATAIDQFEEDIAEVDTTTAAAKATAIKGVVESFSGVDTVGIDNFCQSIKKITDTDFTGMNDLGDSLKTLGTDAVDKFVSAFTNATPQVMAAASLLVTTLRNGFVTNASLIPNAAKAIVDAAVLSLGNGRDGFYSAGKSCVEGFASGITKNTFMATAKARAMAQKAYEAAKNALAVNSPSKIFRSLGYSVPEGFALGIDRLGGMVEDSSIGMADKALSSTKNAISRIADVINADIDAQPTIRPVVDLTDISAGANAISGMFDVSPSVGVRSNISAINSMMNNRQNGSNSDVISAINDLGKRLSKKNGDTFNVQGISYDDGTNVSEAVKTLVRAVRVERRT